MTTSANETSAYSMPVQLSQSQVPQIYQQLNPTFIASQPKIRSVKLSPNGDFVLYQVTQFYRSTSRPLSTLWLAETNKPSSAIPITRGEFYDRSGVFHPDGTRILFLSDRQAPGKKSVIYQLSLADYISSIYRDRSDDVDAFDIADTIDKDSSSYDDIIIDEVLTCPIPTPSTIPEPTVLTSKFAIANKTNVREFATSPSGELVGFLADNDHEEGIATEIKKKDVDVIEMGSSSSSQTKGRLSKFGVYNFTTGEIRMFETRRKKNQQHQLEGFTWSSDSKEILYWSRRNRGMEWSEQVDPDQVLLESISVVEEEGVKRKYLASYPRSPSGSHVWLSTGHIASLQSYEPHNILDARTLHIHHLPTSTTTVTERIYGIDEDAIRIVPACVRPRGEGDPTKNDHDFLAVEVGNDTESRIDIIVFSSTSPTHLSRFTLFHTSSNAIWFNSWDVRRVIHSASSSSNPTNHVTYFFTAVLSSGPYHEPPNVWSGKIHIHLHDNQEEEKGNHKFRTLSRSNQNLVRLSNHLTWLTKTPVLKTEIIYWKNKDGIQLSGLVRFPPNYDTTTHGRIPTILFIHGGPYRRDIPGVFILSLSSSSSVANYGSPPKKKDYMPYYCNWRELLASAGYLIISPNYRASQGRGSAFASSANAGIGVHDWSDCDSMVDQVVRRGWADEHKLGIAGWSHGK